MSPKSPTLLKKILNELESDLAEVFRLPPYSNSGQKIFRRLQKRFDYINNLLAAEVASTPEKTDQLHQIEEKLVGLEAAFRCWDEYQSYALNMYHTQASVCSDCIQTLLDHDDEGPDSPQVEADHFSGGGEGDPTSVGGIFGKLCGAFGSGVIVGVVFCTTLIFPSFYFLQNQDFYFIPPT